MGRWNAFTRRARGRFDEESHPFFRAQNRLSVHRAAALTKPGCPYDTGDQVSTESIACALAYSEILSDAFSQSQASMTQMQSDFE
jgi:hypothetical protein